MLYVETKKGNSIAIIIIARAGGVVYTNFRGDMIEKTSEKIKPDAHKRQVLWGGGELLSGLKLWNIMRLIEHRCNARDHIFVRAVQNMGVNRRSRCNGTVSQGFADVV